MCKGLTQIFPYELELRPRFAGAASRARELFLETFGEPKAGTIRNIDPPKRGKEIIFTDRDLSMEAAKGGLEQVLQKRHRSRGHALLQGFGRERHRHVQVCSFRRQLGDGGFRGAPAAQCD